MNLNKRILLALCILLVDLIVFFLPLTAVFLMYVIIYNPLWFRNFINNLESRMLNYLMPKKTSGFLKALKGRQSHEKQIVQNSKG